MSEHKTISALSRNAAARTIYLGSLHFKAKKTDVEQLLRSHGFDNTTFYWADVQNGMPGQQHTGWCIVQFVDQDTATRAISGLSQVRLHGRPIKTGPSSARSANTTSSQPRVAQAATSTPPRPLSPVPPTAEDDYEKDFRHVERVEDTLTTDAPYKDTVNIFRKAITICSSDSESPEEWHARALQGMQTDSQECISFMPSFLPPAETGANLRTATSNGHVPKYQRPAKVGLGWGDYDLFHEWQANGRQIKKEMVEKKDWKTDEMAPFTFVSEDTGHKIIIDDQLKSYEQDPNPPKSLYDKLNRL